MLLIPIALSWSSQKCNCVCALPAEVQLRLPVTRRSWQKLFVGKNFVKILVTAQTQLRSYCEQQRAFGNSNICNSTKFDKIEGVLAPKSLAQAENWLNYQEKTSFYSFSSSLLSKFSWELSQFARYSPKGSSVDTLVHSLLTSFLLVSLFVLSRLWRHGRGTYHSTCSNGSSWWHWSCCWIISTNWWTWYIITKEETETWGWLHRMRTWFSAS